MPRMAAFRQRTRAINRDACRGGKWPRSLSPIGHRPVYFQSVRQDRAAIGWDLPCNTTVALVSPKF